MASIDFPYWAIVPLPTGHTTEIVSLIPISTGFLTRDQLGITRIWDEEGFQRSVLPPVVAIDYICFASIVGDFVCVAENSGTMLIYKVNFDRNLQHNGLKSDPLELVASGSFKENIATSWSELVTCGYVNEDGTELFVGTSGGAIYHVMRNRQSNIFQGTTHSLRANDGISCRAFTRDEAGDLYAILQNGCIEQLSTRIGATHSGKSIGGNIGLVKVTSDASTFVGIRVNAGSINYQEEDEIVVCDARGNVLHELRAPYVGSLALAGDKLLIASDEDGLLEYDLEAEILEPLFENDPWSEDFSILNVTILQENKAFVVSGVDHAMNTSVLQVWDWSGNKIAEEVRQLESLASFTPSSSNSKNMLIGTSNGGIWVTESGQYRKQNFITMPNPAESVRVLPVNQTTALFLGNYVLKDLDLEDNSGVVWLFDLKSGEVQQELEVYEPVIGGWYDSEKGTAMIFTRGTFQEIKIPSFEGLEGELPFPIDEIDFAASSIVESSLKGTWYVGTERGEVWTISPGIDPIRIIDRSHALGPIEALALGPQGTPLLIGGFYHVAGIYWPQNNGFQKIYGLNAAINCIAPHPNSPFFACGLYDGQLRLFDYNGNNLAIITPKHTRVIAISWDNPKELTAAYASGEIGTWDISSLPILSSVGLKNQKAEKEARNRWKS